mgnify:CR=1 FL=1
MVSSSCTLRTSNVATVRAFPVGHISAGELRDLQLGRAQRRGNIEPDAAAVRGIDLKCGGERLILRAPRDLDPASGLLRIGCTGCVAAVAAVDGHAVALCNKADDVVARHRRAAAREFDHAGIDILDDDAGILVAAALARLGLLLHLADRGAGVWRVARMRSSRMRPNAFAAVRPP